MYWLDYSAAKLSGPTIKAAGYGGVIRYIDSPDRLGAKHTNKAEYDSHIAAGLGVQLVMQTTTTASDGGTAAGVDHARRALAGANLLGYHGRIYFTNDRPTLPSSQKWDDYLTGACSVLGPERVGAYGFANAMDVAVNATPVTGFWLAGSRSGVAPRSYLHFWQDNNTQVTVGGITCDRNLVLKDLTKEDTMSEADAWNGVAGLIKSLKTGGEDVRSVLVDIVREGSWWGVAELLKSLSSESAADVRDVLVRIAKDGNAEVLAAIAGLTPGEFTPEQVAALGQQLTTNLVTTLGPSVASAVLDEASRRLAG